MEFAESFEDLRIWQRARELANAVYDSFAKCREFDFRNQIQSAATSVINNIAEGMERSSVADRAKFLDYARGSCGEFRTQAVVGVKAGFIESVVSETWINESREISAMIQGLIRSLRSN